MHPDCVLTVIKLFAKTVKYECCMKGILDVICPNCNYSFGTSMIIDRSKENSK